MPNPTVLHHHLPEPPAVSPNRRRLRRATLAVAAGLLLAACGAGPGPSVAPQRSTRSIDELVTVGQGRLHVRCEGTGDATVLLLAGWDNGSETWAAVEPALAERTRVCSYDRFGTGASDPPAAPQTFETQVADLHELLDRIGETGPYVVVGHSFGGAQAVTFAAAHRDEVTGLVLVDASPPTWPSTVCSVPAYASGCALMRNPSEGERLDVFPAFAAVASIASLDDLPMTVITAAHRSSDGITATEHERLDRLWQEGVDAWAGLSTASRVVTLEDTGHVIQLERPADVLAEVTKLLP